jgi:hypothetical protein
MSNLFPVNNSPRFRNIETPKPRKTRLDKCGCCICCGAKWAGKAQCFYCKTFIDLEFTESEEEVNYCEEFSEDTCLTPQENKALNWLANGARLKTPFQPIVQFQGIKESRESVFRRWFGNH